MPWSSVEELTVCFGFRAMEGARWIMSNLFCCLWRCRDHQSERVSALEVTESWPSSRREL